MRWQLASGHIVGGMRPATGKAPFARGAAVLQRLAAADRFLQVHGYEGTEAVGDEIDGEAWEALLTSAQATRLRTPVAAQLDAALWVFRASFAEREDALARLSRAGALVQREEVTPGGAVAAVVREDLGNAIRDELALEQFERAWRAAQGGRWPEAHALADLSYVLSRGLVVERLALYALALEHVGRKTASDGLIEMATNSRGAAFGQAVRDRRAEYAEQCRMNPPPAGLARTSPPRFRDAFQRGNKDLHRSFRGQRAGAAA